MGLSQIHIKTAQSIIEKDEYYYDEDDEIDCLNIDAINAIFQDDSLVKDRKILVDMENVLCENYPTNSCDIGNNLVGLQTLENGFTFFGIIMGGDWESPIFTIL